MRVQRLVGLAVLYLTSSYCTVCLLYGPWCPWRLLRARTTARVRKDRWTFEVNVMRATTVMKLCWRASWWMETRMHQGSVGLAVWDVNEMEESRMEM